MDFNGLASSRRSIRGFQKKPVENELIIKLIEAARAAPSGGNCQPWHFYIIKDEELIRNIRSEAINQEFITSAPVVIVVCADIKRSEYRYGERGRYLYCIQDTAAAVQNILLCAKSLGLGTCWCGAFKDVKLSEILNLDKDMKPVALIPVGYYSGEPEAPARRSISEIATFIEG